MDPRSTASPPLRSATRAGWEFVASQLASAVQPVVGPEYPVPREIIEVRPRPGNRAGPCSTSSAPSFSLPSRSSERGVSLPSRFSRCVTNLGCSNAQSSSRASPT
jgi:hypothetical protein